MNTDNKKVKGTAWTGNTPDMNSIINVNGETDFMYYLITDDLEGI